MSAYTLLANGRPVFEVEVERPAWIAGQARLPSPWLKQAVERALRKYFASRSASVFTV